jgi:peptidoglycan/xylan/chitin deacetylase (PgdA/CDA1 family)/cellulose synthase/poly-beta-1,6-N-acetylglucosamine synthase-like glycosyltransferase
MNTRRPFPDPSFDHFSQTPRNPVRREAGAMSQLVGLEALGAMAITRPLREFDAEPLAPHPDPRCADTPDRNYGEPELTIRSELAYAEEDRGDSRPWAWFKIFDVIASVVILAGLAILTMLTGQLHMRLLLSRVTQYLISLHLPAVLGLIIATAMIGIVLGCVLYRIKTRVRRIVPDCLWGSFAGSSRAYGPPSLPCSRSGTVWGRLAISLIILIVIAAIAVTTLISWHGLLSSPVVLSYWLLANGTLLFCMAAFFIGRRFNSRPIAAGRVAAIVPAYDEDPEELRAVVESIVGQSIPPEMVYVVDDGSKIPVGQPFYHPRVTWLRKENGGKRSAQVYVLERMNPADWDFILTVDGDSILDRYALEHQLRAFSPNRSHRRRHRRAQTVNNSSVMATTGMVLVRNRKYNLLTRLADMNIGTSCVMMRASRSLLGTLETTSGALAVYRAHILFKHKERYLNGSYGDDRALAMYSALEGEVVGVNEAVVWSGMPTDAKLTYKQRLRWSKSWWCMIPFVLTNMLRFRQMFFPLFGLTQLAIAPLTIGYIFLTSLYAVAHADFHPSTLLLYVAVYLVVRYAMTALYMVERPGMRLPERFLTWLLITPLEAIYNLIFLNPTKYIALVKLHDHHWGTRGAAVKVSRAKRLFSVAGVVLGISALAASIAGATWAGSLPLTLPPPPPNLPVLDNNASSGKVVFTFDDGPGIRSLKLVSELKAEHVPAVFFEIGERVAANPRIVRAEVKAGFRIEVHTWDHRSLTGASTHTKALTDAQVRWELVKCINAIVAAGAPRPTLWRPPYGDVNVRDVAIASSLGLRLIMPWSINGTISDNGDWEGISAVQIVHNVTSGWADGVRIHRGSIVAGHDGNYQLTPFVIAAMPEIVRWMNAHRLGATDQIPADATGGDLPPLRTTLNSGTG